MAAPEPPRRPRLAAFGRNLPSRRSWLSHASLKGGVVPVDPGTTQYDEPRCARKDGRRMRQARRGQRRRRSLLALALMVVAGALTGAARPHDRFDRRSGHLEAALLEAVRTQRFDRVVDFGPVEGACPGSSWCPSPAPTVAHVPNIDLAVIALDGRGRPRAAADVLLARDYPHGIGVPIGDDLG